MIWPVSTFVCGHVTSRLTSLRPLRPVRFEYDLAVDELRFRRLSVTAKNNSASFRSRDVIGQVGLDLLHKHVAVHSCKLGTFRISSGALSTCVNIRLRFSGADRVGSHGPDCWCHRLVSQQGWNTDIADRIMDCCYPEHPDKHSRALPNTARALLTFHLSFACSASVSSRFTLRDDVE